MSINLFTFFLGGEREHELIAALSFSLVWIVLSNVLVLKRKKIKKKKSEKQTRTLRLRSFLTLPALFIWSQK